MEYKDIKIRYIFRNGGFDLLIIDYGEIDTNIKSIKKIKKSKKLDLGYFVMLLAYDEKKLEIDEVRRIIKETSKDAVDKFYEKDRYKI